MAEMTVDEMSRRLRLGEFISFRRFMNTALYSLDGYYNCSVKIGGDGADFYTAALSPLFAFTVANAIHSAWKRLSCPDELQVVELGAGQGELSLQVVKRLKRLLPRVSLRYVIVEKSALLLEIQKKKILGQNQPDSDAYLGDNWLWGIPKPDMDSVIIGNEVLDAFPVERVKKDSGTWKRSYITIEDGLDAYREIWRNAPRWLADFAEAYSLVPEGCVSELCLSYPSFSRKCAAFGRNVEFILFDYGIYTEELMSGIRPEGTARGYRRHQVCEPFTEPGKVDITADVPWYMVEKILARAGFTDISLMKQGEFLIQNDIESILMQLRSEFDRDPIADMKLVGECKQLCLPGGFGERFQVLTGRRIG